MPDHDLPLFTAVPGKTICVNWEHTVRAHEDDMITEPDGRTYVFHHGRWEPVTAPDPH